MPTIAEVAQQLVSDNIPVLFIDTWIFLDIIRSPIRRLSGCIQSALELAQMQSQSQSRVVASSLILAEWKEHEFTVANEVDRIFAQRDLDAATFHDACAYVKIPLAFAQANYHAARLTPRLHALERSEELA